MKLQPIFFKKEFWNPTQNSRKSETLKPNSKLNSELKTPSGYPSRTIHSSFIAKNMCEDLFVNGWKILYRPSSRGPSSPTLNPFRVVQTSELSGPPYFISLPPFKYFFLRRTLNHQTGVRACALGLRASSLKGTPFNFKRFSSAFLLCFVQDLTASFYSKKSHLHTYKLSL